jgi:hypothetical protein
VVICCCAVLAWQQMTTPHPSSAVRIADPPMYSPVGRPQVLVPISVRA